jgi:transposase
MPTRVVQRDGAVERLAEVVTMRRQLCDEDVAVENQAAHLQDAMLRRLSKRRLVRLEADIRLLDKRLAEMVATNAAFAARQTWRMTVIIGRRELLAALGGAAV